MRYKFSFSYTPEKQFRVTAVASGPSGRSLGVVPVSAQYSSDESFLRLVDRANLAPDDYARLVYAAMVAVTDTSVATCCEEAELDLQQLNLLHLNTMQQRIVA